AVKNGLDLVGCPSHDVNSRSSCGAGKVARLLSELGNAQLSALELGGTYVACHVPAVPFARCGNRTVLRGLNEARIIFHVLVIAVDLIEQIRLRFVVTGQGGRIGGQDEATG